MAWSAFSSPPKLNFLRVFDIRRLATPADSDSTPVNSPPSVLTAPSSDKGVKGRRKRLEKPPSSDKGVKGRRKRLEKPSGGEKGAEATTSLSKTSGRRGGRVNSLKRLEDQRKQKATTTTTSLSKRAARGRGGSSSVSAHSPASSPLPDPPPPPPPPSTTSPPSPSPTAQQQAGVKKPKRQRSDSKEVPSAKKTKKINLF